MTSAPPSSETPAGPRVCAACGALVTGRFCAHCGASADAGFCSSCGASLAPGARFCHRCGTPNGSPSRSGNRERTAWAIAGIAVVALALAILWWGGGFRPVSAPDMANSGTPPGGGATAVPGRLPDIAGMSPAERFGRLWDRVIRAAEAGDTNTVAQFSPMALSAYSQLPEVNTDLRFHAALIRLAIGDFPPALALADTLLTHAPGHLFGYLVRGEVADRQNQLPALERSYREFLSHYDAELRSGRLEYEDHKP